MLDEGGLERMQLITSRQTLDRGDLGTIMHDGQRRGPSSQIGLGLGSRASGRD